VKIASLHGDFYAEVFDIRKITFRKYANAELKSDDVYVLCHNSVTLGGITATIGSYDEIWQQTSYCLYIRRLAKVSAERI
jgi:hypothetical protein